ncbi:MAG: DUF971 domain-containing protein [Pirellulaceae bacterium]|jgi:DUF971 family protein|nr:DUF971 domain-containing protein [Pirellulaceae bacterium]
MPPLPTNITRDGPSLIVIHWSDELVCRYAASELRKRCPCATCREKHTPVESTQARPLSLPVLSMAEAQPLSIEGMRPVGNYAYNIAFSDGHDSGIFTFEYLRELGQA